MTGLPDGVQKGLGHLGGGKRAGEGEGKGLPLFGEKLLRSLVRERAARRGVQGFV